MRLFPFNRSVLPQTLYGSVCKLLTFTQIAYRNQLHGLFES